MVYFAKLIMWGFFRYGELWTHWQLWNAQNKCIVILKYNTYYVSFRPVLCWTLSDVQKVSVIVSTRFWAEGCRSIRICESSDLFVPPNVRSGMLVKMQANTPTLARLESTGDSSKRSSKWSSDQYGHMAEREPVSPVQPKGFVWHRNKEQTPHGETKAGQTEILVLRCASM